MGEELDAIASEAAWEGLRHAAIGKRVAETLHESVVMAETDEEAWLVVRTVCVLAGLPGVCVMQRGRMYECGRTANGEELDSVQSQIPGGRVVVLVEERTRQAGYALLRVMRLAYREREMRPVRLQD
jgi:hypothetical protein